MCLDVRVPLTLFSIKVSDVVGGGCAGVQVLDCKPGAPGYHYLAITKGNGIPMQISDTEMMDKIKDYCTG